MPGQKPYEVAPAKKGRDAVDYIGRQVFEAPLWLYPSSMTDIAGTDLVDEISTYQDRILKVMMNGTIMDKIYKDQRVQVLISSKTILMICSTVFGSHSLVLMICRYAHVAYSSVTM